MPSLLTTMFLASAAAAPAGGFAPPGDEVKCQARGGAPDMLDAVVLLDHKVLEGDLTDGRFQIASLRDQIAPMEIASIEIVCWRWSKRAMVSNNNVRREPCLETLARAQTKPLRATILPTVPWWD